MYQSVSGAVENGWRCDDCRCVCVCVSVCGYDMAGCMHAWNDQDALREGLYADILLHLAGKLMGQSDEYRVYDDIYTHSPSTISFLSFLLFLRGIHLSRPEDGVIKASR